MKLSKIGLILVQISEAHTKKWPLGMDDHPSSHQSFQERVERANSFNSKYPFFQVYVDSWENEFENKFQAWPDKYYFLNKDLKVIEKSDYGMDAVVLYDYSNLLADILN